MYPEALRCWACDYTGYPPLPPHVATPGFLQSQLIFGDNYALTGTGSNATHLLIYSNCTLVSRCAVLMKQTYNLLSIPTIGNLRCRPWKYTMYHNTKRACRNKPWDYIKHAYEELKLQILYNNVAGLDCHLLYRFEYHINQSVVNLCWCL